MPTPINHPPLPTSPKQRRFWTPPHGSARALLVAEAARSHEGLVVVVTRDTQRAHALEDELRIFAGSLPVPRRLGPLVHQNYFHSPVEQFQARTMWALSNAFTSAFKELDPIPQMQASAKLATTVPTGPS